MPAIGHEASDESIALFYRYVLVPLVKKYHDEIIKREGCVHKTIQKCPIKGKYFCTLCGAPMTVVHQETKQEV